MIDFAAGFFCGVIVSGFFVFAYAIVAASRDREKFTANIRIKRIETRIEKLEKEILNAEGENDG